MFSSAIACDLALIPFELVEFPGTLLVLCFVVQCLPALFALGFLLCLFSCFLLCPKASQVFSVPSSFLRLSLLSVHFQPLIFKAHLMNRKNCCTSYFSFIHPGCREASHFLRCTCICAVSTARNCSYHPQRWFVGRYNPSLSLQLDIMASVHVFFPLKAWCSNRLSSCNSELGRRE